MRSGSKLNKKFSGFPITKRVLSTLGAVLLIILVSMFQICDALFGCGCLPLWAGGITYCNVFVDGPPNCPLCMGGLTRLLTVSGIVALPVVSSILLLAHRTRAGIITLIAAGTFVYIAAIVAAGALFAAIDGSNHFGAFLRDLPSL